MLPICAATTSCSAHSQITLQGGLQPFSSFRKAFDVRCSAGESSSIGLCGTKNLHGCSFKAEEATPTFYSNFIDNGKYNFSNGWNYYIADSDISSGEQTTGLEDQITENANILVESADPQTVIPVDVLPNESGSSSDLLTIDNESLSKVKTNIGDVLTKGEDLVNSFTKEINSFLSTANKSVDDTISKLSFSVDQIKESANSKLTSLSSDLNEASSNVGASSVDVLRRVILQIEGSLNQGASYAVYGYESAKELLPPEVQNAVNFSEGTAVNILKPVGTAFEQIYVAISELEKILGVDPNDPIVHLILFVGTTATLWVSYMTITYGGYAGDLSPQSTFELLKGKDNVVLVDVRPEILREKDGIPDLRRGARFRYADVTLPEIGSSVKKLMKSGKDLDDALIATIIRNLKIIQDRSKVVVMDADGTRSKAIARSLRKLGVKQPYLVQGGFRSWVKEGLRVKELKPETTLTILNEEAEAILEEINPTPLGVVGYGVGLVAALYGLLEWEKTLQLIGVLGLVQSIYRRMASYEGADDFKQDVRLLLTPVRAGGEAISWAAGKLETNGIGLPTSPSSSDVQNRVLQAAAKHESKPLDATDENPDLTAPVSEGADLSEA